eukprot:gnl/MRDRNA2_/MRDRNA2_108448_c0_seq1.p1 gnl/MRDRNA2_/MRDRNA2_108448_c0~~gnl/MRDRNA2_/MRDRNA2_108448_c0_seq1.p1  ORF type:complete len:567 (+),score=72.67 gnl/MRDRNA2_/MRDRNA2_108448_c0_seq1:83-1783(+)
MDENGELEPEFAVKVRKGPYTLLHALEDEMPILPWLLFSSTPSLFRTCMGIRSLLSRQIVSRVSFDVVGEKSQSSSLDAGVLGRQKKARLKLHQSLALGPWYLHLRIPSKEAPLRMVTLRKFLYKMMPMVLWEDTIEGRKVHLILRNVVIKGETALMGNFLWRFVRILGRSDIPALLAEPKFFENVEYLILDLGQVQHFQDLVFPRVKRIKISCHKFAVTNETLQSVPQIFPSLERLHLNCAPLALPMLCAMPDFRAPPDFRLSLSAEDNSSEQRVSMFVASHLYVLPFSWGVFLQNVQRLQLSELATEFQGLEHFMELLSTLPHLKRLGTVSAYAARCFDFTRETCGLEELVLTVESDQVHQLFASFLTIEQRKRRCGLKRLAVHLMCSDGIARVPYEIELALFAGWYWVASTLLHIGGWLCFSVNQQQLTETAVLQAPWTFPQYFTFDASQYPEGVLPRSTPLADPLPYFEALDHDRPSGTLVSAPPRIVSSKSIVDGTKTMRSKTQMLQDTHGTQGGESNVNLGDTGGAGFRRIKNWAMATIDENPEWLPLSLFAAIEITAKY